jgi:hypothetical protein
MKDGAGSKMTSKRGSLGRYKMECSPVYSILIRFVLNSNRIILVSFSIYRSHSQFYIPLFAYVFIAIAVFCFLVFKVSEFSFSDASTASTRRGSAQSTPMRRSSSTSDANGAGVMDDERIAERNTILMRLGLQFFVMPFIFLPDRCESMQ